jgi:hypothetical protein
MNKRLLTFVLTLFFIATGVYLFSRHRSAHLPVITHARRIPGASPFKLDAKAIDAVPLGFEENRGQVDPDVKFLARGPGYAVYLNSSEAVFVHRFSHSLSEFNPVASSAENLLGSSRGKSAVHLQWLNANPHAGAHALDPQQGITNYFIGNDPKKWRRKLPLYGQVAFDGLYPGIDLVYHGDQKRVEFDYRVAPGADPSAIQLGIGTPSSVGITKDGELSIVADGDEVVLHPPIAYQELGGRHQLVPARYVLKDNHRVAFEVGAFDHSRTLVIDPVLDFAASFGTGSNSTILNSVAVDSGGNAYVAGETCDTSYPVTAGALKQGGGSLLALDCYDIVVSKFDPTGSTLLYSTYIGGQSEITATGRIVVDAAGELYLAGVTTASDFPTTANAFQKQFKGGTCDYGPFLKQKPCSDGLLLKLSADGSTLLFATFLGGERADLATSLVVDPATQDVYVTGATNSTTFPTAGAPVQAAYGGGSCVDDAAPCFDAFVSKFSSDGSALLASTYWGGNDNDYGSDIALDATGNVYVTGNSTSTNFTTTTGAFQTAHAGTTPQPDAFVVKLNPALSTLQYSTLIGGDAYDLAFALRVDSTGAAYITGSTASSNFPTTAGVFQTSYAGPANADCPDAIDSSLLDQPSCGDVFVTKLNSAGSALVFSTLLGGSQPDIAFNLALDSAKNVWVFGGTNSTDFPFTPDAYYQTGSLFLTELSPDGKNELFSTPLGAGGLSLGLAIDSTDSVFVAGQASIFSVTPGAYSTNNGGGVFLAKFSPGTARPGVQLSGTSLSFTPPAVVTAVNSASAPQSVTLTNNGTGTLHLALTLVPPFGVTTPPFSESDNCGSSLAAGANCTISAVFQPTTAAFNQGTLIQITSDAPGSPQTISLNGSSGIIESASFTPAALNFPGQAPGTTSASQMSNLNGSATSANSFFVRPTSNPVIGGANLADFAVDTSQCSVAANACLLTVSFKPVGATPVNRTATVTVPTQAANSPEVLTLTGTVSTTPVISTSGLFLSPTVVGQTFNGSLAITNTGGAALGVTGVTVSGVNASDFTVQSNINCGPFPFSLASQGLCALGVAFKPSAPGNRTATLTFADNETTATSLTVSGFAATAGGPEISLVTTPSPINGVIAYPDTVVGHVTNFNIAIIAPLNLGSGAGAGVHITEALSGDFVLAPAPNTTCTLPVVLLAGGASCNYVVLFAPTAVGPRTGTLTLTTDAPGTPSLTVKFAGNGVTIPAPMLTPLGLNFGPVVSGASSAAQNVTLANTGNGPLTFSAPVLAGPFSLSGNTCASPLAAAGSCTLSVKFNAPAKGPASGTLSLVSNAAGQTLAVGLRGTGVTGPVPSVLPASLVFGNQPMNTTSAAQPVTLLNAGDTSFNVLGIHASENFSETNTCGASLAPGASCTINISFAPSSDTFAMFPSNGQVFVTTSAPGSPLGINVSGTPTASTAAATTIAITSSLDPSTAGQSVTFTATVTSQTAGTITGTVTFLDGGTSIGTGSLSSGKATFTTTALTAGNHSVTASYPGDANFAPSHSSGILQTVNAGSLAASSTALASSGNPSALGQSVTFTATVASQTAGTITGSVNFLDGATQLGSGAISSGKATFSTTTLTQGTHAITAHYLGDTNFASSTSAAVTQTVTGAALAPTTTALASSANPSTVSQSVLFTATVTSQTAGAITGAVNFLDGSTSIGSGTVSGGKATVSTSALTAGTHSITAQYPGDATFAPSASALLSQVVNPSGDFGVSVSPTTLSLPAGQSGTSTITVSPLAGATFAVNLSCGTLPAKLSCSVSPASVTQDGTNPKTATVMIGTVLNSALPAAPPVPQFPRYPVALSVCGLLAVLLFAARQQTNPAPRRAFLVAALLVAACGIGSCNGGGSSAGSSGTTPGTYPITLTGVSAAGALTHSTTLTVTVTK